MKPRAPAATFYALLTARADKSQPPAPEPLLLHCAACGHDAPHRLADNGVWTRFTCARCGHTEDRRIG